MEGLTKVCFMLLLSPAGNKDVIQIAEDKWDAPKNTIHRTQECLGGILKPKRHAKELPELAERSDHGHLGMSADATRISW